MSETRARDQAPSHPDVRYETRDANLRLVVYVGIGLAVGVAVVMWALLWLVSYLQGREAAAKQSQYPLMEATDPLPPSPRLEGIPPDPLDETDPEHNLGRLSMTVTAEMRKREEEILASYGTFELEPGKPKAVHIPITEAMRLVVQDQQAKTKNREATKGKKP